MNIHEIEGTTAGLANHLHQIEFPGEPLTKPYDQWNLVAAVSIIDDPRTHLQALVDAGVLERRHEAALVDLGGPCWPMAYALKEVYEIRVPEPEPHEHTPQVSLISGNLLVMRCADNDCHEHLGSIDRSDSRIATLLEPTE